jgi:hypothetical protein
MRTGSAGPVVRQGGPRAGQDVAREHQGIGARAMAPRLQRGAILPLRPRVGAAVHAAGIEAQDGVRSFGGRSGVGGTGHGRERNQGRHVDRNHDGQRAPRNRCGAARRWRRPRTDKRNPSLPAAQQGPPPGKCADPHACTGFAARVRPRPTPRVRRSGRTSPVMDGRCRCSGVSSDRPARRRLTELDSPWKTGAQRPPPLHLSRRSLTLAASRGRPRASSA